MRDAPGDLVAAPCRPGHRSAFVAPDACVRLAVNIRPRGDQMTSINDLPAGDVLPIQPVHLHCNICPRYKIAKLPARTVSGEALACTCGVVLRRLAVPSLVAAALRESAFEPALST